MHYLSRVYGVCITDFSGTITMEQFGVIHAANRSGRIRLLAALMELYNKTKTTSKQRLCKVALDALRSGFAARCEAGLAPPSRL